MQGQQTAGLSADPAGRKRAQATALGVADRQVAQPFGDGRNDLAFALREAPQGRQRSVRVISARVMGGTINSLH